MRAFLLTSGLVLGLVPLGSVAAPQATTDPCLQAALYKNNLDLL